jgi:protein-disulfide isomerase
MSSKHNRSRFLPSRRRGQIVLVLAVVAVALVVVVGVTSQGRSNTAQSTAAGSGTATASNSAPPALELARRIAGDPTALGALKAPVVLIEYADYRCPFCGIFARDTMPKLVDEYVKSGVLRIEWRDFVIYGQQSLDAAVAARAAGEQGLFWKYHDAIYAAAPERAHIALPRKRLREIAKSVGVPDMAKFERDMRSSTFLGLVNADTKEGASIGVTGTPSFVVNNTTIVGAQPIDVFRQAIESALAEARK